MSDTARPAPPTNHASSHTLPTTSSTHLSAPIPSRPASPEPASGPNMTMPFDLPRRSLQERYKKREIDQPIKILVTDWDMPETQRAPREYHCGANELDMKKVYSRISGMRYHEQRGRVVRVRMRHGEGEGEGEEEKENIPAPRLKPCTPSYLNDFFAYSLTYIIDYLLDFHADDTSFGQRTFHHLITRLQAAATQLPHAYWDTAQPSCPHARFFTEQYEASMSFINFLLSRRRERLTDNLVHYTRPMIDGEHFRFGEYVNGFKPWEQWVLGGSPGFGGAEVDGDGEKEMEWELEHETELYQYGVREGQVSTTRYVPMGALGIVQRHSERMRKVAERVADQEHPGEAGAVERVAFLREFDDHALSLTHGNEYTSLTGHKTIARPMTFTTSNPASAPHRVTGFMDPSALMTEPGLWKLDEATGQARGLEPVEHPAGADKFQMMTVSTVGRREEGEARFGEMFEAWKIGKPVKRSK
ncbi:hypothetical protein K491DRAFT_717603 [Lophiostoma macrostomum CBS 122681]|uniref:Uncharacterized protein n=1 Tax=Lophiostoma macrostomum CBS 122681 TaxID=1314788 RepID=A0A6A6T3S3_9PLEO|nr:hypothetical protein K491DRAFT_717603 [Lophiostoma macrostomum CBS 122681]